MLTLHSFAISHFSEKIRWTLRLAGIPFVERALTPGLHVPATLLIGRRATSVPIVSGDGLREQGSDRILARLAIRGLLDGLLPEEDEARDEALAGAAGYNALGRAVMITGYGPLLADPGEVFRMWTLVASRADTALLRAAMPLLLPAFRQRFAITGDANAQARATIEASLDEIAERRGGRLYLSGDFGLEDLSVCALLAPLAGPDQHPLYGSSPFRDSVAAAIAPWRRHPTLVWVRDVYARQRPQEPEGSVLVKAAARLKR